MPYFLANSSGSQFIILPGISAPATMLRAVPQKGLPYLFKLPTSPAICSSCFLIFPGVDSLWFEAVLKFILFFNSFLSLPSIWKFRMKSFSASTEVLYSHLIGPPVTLTSLLMVTSLTKSPRIIENLFPLWLAPRPKVFK